MNRIPRAGDKVYRHLDGRFMGIVKHVTNPFMYLEQKAKLVNKGVPPYVQQPVKERRNIDVLNWHNNGHLNPTYDIGE